MGWTLSNYPTKWGTPANAYISTCSSDIRVFATTPGGYQQVTYYEDQLVPMTSNEIITSPVEYVDGNGSNVTSNVYVSNNTVLYDGIVQVQNTCNVVIPRAYAVTCDVAVYPSKDARLKEPMVVFERVPIYNTMDPNNKTMSVHDYIYQAIAEKFPGGISD